MCSVCVEVHSHWVERVVNLGFFWGGFGCFLFSFVFLSTVFALCSNLRCPFNAYDSN